jgi:hypothetical protein
MNAVMDTEAGQRCAPIWARVAVVVLLAGYVLFAHGCHGDEDNELFDALPAIQGAAE